MRHSIVSDSAPAALGPYSQAIKVGEMIFLSGQIPLDPATQTLVSTDFRTQVIQVFLNMQAVCKAANVTLHEIVKLTIYLTDLANFSLLNDVMQEFFVQPYPARTTIEISALPKNSAVEIEAIIALSQK